MSAPAAAPATATTGLSAFVASHRELLSLEREEELSRSSALLSGLSAKQLALRGLCLRNLSLAARRSGLFGRTVLDFAAAVAGGVGKAELPAHDISVGDICGLFNSSVDDSVQVSSGVVTTASAASISVSFDNNNEREDLAEISDADRYRLVKLANDVTYRRLKSAVDALADERGQSSLLKGCLFGTSELSPPLQQPHPAILDTEGEIRFFNGALDDSQRRAVRFALLQKEIAVIHGPPGTGKTTTVVETIAQASKSGEKILCCAPSNVAVDNLLERLSKLKGLRLVRLGHPARMYPHLQRYSLDAQISFSEQTKIVADVRKDIDKTLAKMKGSRGKGDRVGASRELKELRKELREREQEATASILRNADVVLATLTSASPDGPLRHFKGKKHFDVTVIDECSQSLELACWIVLPFAGKVILAGDHQQLPPTIMSESAARRGLSYTLMERVIKELHHADVVRMLETQYRMNRLIMEWSSQAFYEGRLKASDRVREHLLTDLPGVSDHDDTRVPLVMIDTAGCEMYELETSDEISRANEGEASLVCIHIKSLIRNGVKPEDIAVITPYNLQVELIRLQLSPSYPSLEIRSVDGFQGREKEAVVLSLVRSNPAGELGFLTERRRLNVAVTRGRRQVVVVGDGETVSKDDFLAEFVRYAQESGEVRSAMQYTDQVDAVQLVRPEGMELTVKDGGPGGGGGGGKSAVSVKKHQKKDSARPAKPPEKKGRVDEVKPALKKGPFHRTKKDAINDHDPSENADDAKRRDFLAKIESFVNSSKLELSFSQTLNSHDRMVVHELAEELNLIHESVGEGKERHIVVRKKGNVIEEKLEDVSLDDNSFQKSSQPDPVSSSKCTLEPVPLKPSDIVTCCDCNAQMPRNNIELHKLRCRKTTVQVDKPSKAPKAKKGKSKKKSEQQQEEEDIDKLLASFDKVDNVCNGDKCKERLTVLGVTCEHCRARFCLKHGIPEAHGCGDAARRAARQLAAREGKLYPGSGRPDHRPNPARRKQLQGKLEKKLGEMEGQRKTKKKEK